MRSIIVHVFCFALLVKKKQQTEMKRYSLCPVTGSLSLQDLMKRIKCIKVIVMEGFDRSSIAYGYLYITVTGVTTIYKE